MAKLAEIKNVMMQQVQRNQPHPMLTIYVNPLNVTSLEPIGGGARISLVGGGSFQTTTPMPEVVKAIQEAMG
jgi:hypothetical protein